MSISLPYRPILRAGILEVGHPGGAGSARGAAPERDEGPVPGGAGPSFVPGTYLVSGSSFGSFAYAAAALSLVTMTGGSRKAGTTLTPLS